MVSDGGVKTIVISAITTALAILALSLRLWSRRSLKLRLAFSDYAAIAALIFLSATNALAIASKFKIYIADIPKNARAQKRYQLLL